MADERPRVLIAEARFYDDIADDLAAGATAKLDAAGCAYDRIQVPGVFELPAALEMGRAGGGYDGFVALGCVIRGETDHYDHICREASRALMEFAVGHKAAHGFGVLTCENGDQARERADPTRRDVGGRAAEACLAMMAIRKQYGLDGG